MMSNVLAWSKVRRAVSDESAEATAFLGPHPLCASLFTPGRKGLLIPVALNAVALHDWMLIVALAALCAHNPLEIQICICTEGWPPRLTTPVHHRIGDRKW